MNETTNAEKLRIKEDSLVWVISSNEEAASLLDPLPQGTSMVEEPTPDMSAVVLFVEDEASLVEQLDEVLPQLGATPVIWIGFPKRNRSDINRDKIAALIAEYGWRLVGVVSLDETWSAVRLSSS